MRLGAAGLGCLASLFLGLAASIAQEGHDHGDADKAPVVSSAYPRVAARSDLYEIVGILKDSQLSIFIDDAVTNEPITDAALQVTIGGSAPTEARKAENGVYTATLPDPKPTGSVEVIFAVTAKKGDDLLVDSFTLPPPVSGPAKHEHAWLSAGRAAATLALGGLGLGLLAGYLSIYGGRVVPSESAIPRIGQLVSKGEMLIQIEPHLPVADRTTILEKVGEIEQLIAVAENKVRRLRPLAERGAVPQGQLNDLESELEGLRARRETVRNSRTGHEVLRASTDGIITAAKVVPGQVIQPQDVLFQIADPKGLWVEAFAYTDIDFTGPVEATAVGPNGQSLPLSYIRQYRVTPNVATMQALGVTHDQIEQAVAR